jgi:hypothetical protein
VVEIVRRLKPPGPDNPGRYVELLARLNAGRELYRLGEMEHLVRTDAFDWMLRAARDRRTREKFFQAASAGGSDALFDALSCLLADPALWEPAVAALETDVRSARCFEQCLATPGPPALKRRLIEALGRKGSWRAVPALVEQLDDRGLRAATRDALKSITGEDFGPRPAPWRRWLAERNGG